MNFPATHFNLSHGYQVYFCDYHLGRATIMIPWVTGAAMSLGSCFPCACSQQGSVRSQVPPYPVSTQDAWGSQLTIKAQYISLSEAIPADSLTSPACLQTDFLNRPRRLALAYSQLFTCPTLPFPQISIWFPSSSPLSIYSILTFLARLWSL